MSQKNKEAYSIRLDSELLDKVKDRADQEGGTVTAIFERALISFLSAPNTEGDQSTDSKEIQALKDRVARLEGIVLSKAESPKPEPISPNDVGDLITIKQAVALTGYSESTLSSKFSRLGVEAVDRVNGNRAGLYSKDEILERIGTK